MCSLVVRSFVLVLVSVGVPLLGAGPLDRDTGELLTNWSAPPYWQAGPAAPQANTDPRQPHVVLPVDPSPLPFVAISPCRVADTRGNGFSGAYGPPSLGAGVERTMTITGQCGIPTSARAVSANFTVTNTTGGGFLGVYPQGSTFPGVSTLNFTAGQTIANAAVVPLSSTGAMTAVAGAAGFDLIVDLNGYYANPPTASSGAFDARQLATGRWFEAVQTGKTALTVGNDPWGMAFDGLYMWVVNGDSNDVTRVLTGSNVVVSTHAVGTRPQNVVSDGVNLWITNYGSVPASLSKLRTSDVAVTPVPLSASASSPYGIAFDGSSIWVSGSDSSVGGGALWKVNASTGATTATVPLVWGNPKDVIFDGTWVWAANNDSGGTLTRVDPTTLAKTNFSTGGDSPTGLAFDGANVWATNYTSGTVTKMRARDGAVVGTYPVCPNPRGIVFDGVNIWVGCTGSGTVYKLRAATGQVVVTPNSGVPYVSKLGFDGTYIWVSGGVHVPGTPGYLSKL